MGTAMVSSGGGDGLVSALRDLLGEDLRVVATYDEQILDIEYERPGIRRKLDDETMEWGHRRIVKRTTELGTLNDELETGSIHAQTTWFDDSMMFLFFRFPFSGVIVDIDNGADPDLPALDRTCRGWLEAQSEIERSE